MYVNNFISIMKGIIYCKQKKTNEKPLCDILNYK